MQGFLSVDELVTAADTEATRLADEAERVLLSDPVPTCPDWTVRQLVEHVGEVHRWAAAIVTRGLLQDLPAEEQSAVRRPREDRRGAAAVVPYRGSPTDRRAEGRAG